MAETETLTIFLETRPSRDVGSLRLETVSRPRRRDRDHNPVCCVTLVIAVEFTENSACHWLIDFDCTGRQVTDIFIFSSSSFYLNRATRPINVNRRHTDRQTDSRSKRKKKTIQDVQ